MGVIHSWLYRAQQSSWTFAMHGAALRLAVNFTYPAYSEAIVGKG